MIFKKKRRKKERKKKDRKKEKKRKEKKRKEKKRKEKKRGESVIEYIACVLIVSATFVRKISHTKKNSARYYNKCTYDLQLNDSLLFADVNEGRIFSIPVRNKKILKYRL